MEKFCEQCGAELTEDVLFCEKCGKPVYGQGIKEKGASYLQPKSEKKKKGGRKAVVISLIVVAVILALMGTGAALYLNSNGYQAGKNMKLAGESYEAGKYEEALSYYKEALRQDETIAEAYLKLAEIYLADKSYDKAIKQLKRGIKRAGNEENGENIELLNTKLVDAYLEKAGSYLEIPDYGQTVEVLKKGIKDTDDGNRFLTDKLVEVYLEEADIFLEQGDYGRAVEVLEEGKAETEDKKNILGDRLEIVSCVMEEDYGQAIAVLKKSLPDAEADLLNDYIVQLRRMESDKYLREGECLMAVQALEKGIEDTGDSSLSEREKYLRENIVIRKERWYSDGELYIEVVFDDSGKLLSNTGYHYCVRADGTPNYLGSDGFPYDSVGFRADTDWHEFEYDGSGKIIKCKTYRDNVIAGWSEYKYDGFGNCVEINDYDIDGNCYGWSEFGYDDAGRITTAVAYFFSDMSYWLRADYEYDEAGNKIREVSSQCEYGVFYSGPRCEEYDEEGNVVRGINYDTDGNVSSEFEIVYEYEYDEKGNATKCTRTKDGAPYVEWEKKYDELGNMIEGCRWDVPWTCEREYAYIGM